MNLYNFNYVLSFLLFYIDIVTSKSLKVLSTGLEPVSSCSTGLKFFVEVNNTSGNDLEVEVTPDQCCLESEEVDCDVMDAYGCLEEVPKGTTKKLKLVAPLIDPFERHGYCTAYIDSKSNRKHITRDTVRIPFDTRIKSKEQIMEIPEDVKLCDKTDEDVLNDCNPVDCDTYYNGKRSYYSRNLKRCVEVTPCVTKEDIETVNNIYNPNTNKCDDESVKDADINYIKSLSDDKSRKAKDIIIIKNINHPTSTMTSLHKNLSRIDFNKTYHLTKVDETEKKCFRIVFAKYLSANKCTLTILGAVILVQCCLICTMVYCLTKSCACCNKKKVVRKFFNYRQDASVTTPLIGTSNIDTETTEFQYMSESSNNIDKKIKCYKACQKERKTNNKISMSDDILSKCLSRRDWNRKPKSEDILEYIITKEEGDVPNVPKDIVEKVESPVKEIKRSDERKSVMTDKKQSAVKVNFENEIVKEKSSKLVKSLVKKIESKSSKDKVKKIDRNDADLQSASSEKEIKCHSYTYTDTKSNLTGFKPSSHSKNLAFLKTEKTKKCPTSLSTEKGAQAYFSNDSLDDFLSERGMIYLAGDNASKYSFSSSNAKRSSASSISSKTSKNIVRNVLSLLHRRSKHGPASDPGLKKSNNSLDMELLHMSRASVYSSSNNDSDCLKVLTSAKDSRQSL